MHVVIRRWSQGAALAEALLAREAEVQEILTSVPGFIAYYALRDGDSVSTITVCDDQAGTTESTQRAGAWVHALVRLASRMNLVSAVRRHTTRRDSVG